jgi:hypothetical protein
MASKRPNPKTGELYRHYTGDVYKVLALSQHSETGEFFVIYRLKNAHDDVIAWARPLAMFLEDVRIPDPADTILGVLVQRFTKL